MVVALLCACGKPGSPPQRDSAFSAASGVARATEPVKAHSSRAVTADDRRYRDRTGIQMAGELIVMRIRELPGTMIPLHSTRSMRTSRSSGNVYFAVGDKWDKSALKELAPATMPSPRRAARCSAIVPTERSCRSMALAHSRFTGIMPSKHSATPRREHLQVSQRRPGEDGSRRGSDQRGLRVGRYRPVPSRDCDRRAVHGQREQTQRMSV